LKEAQALLKEFCVSDETSEFTHINKVCKVPPQLLGAFVDVDNHTLPSATERGMLFIV
jgi:hypothetical protein